MSWLKYISYSLVALLVASNIIVSHKLIKTTKEAPSLHTSVYKYELETYAFSTILMSHVKNADGTVYNATVTGQRNVY